ncbi:uncharacterized protein LOC121405367 [Drosophila obscura]|uniref:uncharacterized protein LOC121405367 n=1 Tax=Drosophila obscura TaxID=7282 RepID=UPI001BB28C83|nr:uncharacterized protein LOC121405367 [Drosophila obscura]
MKAKAQYKAALKIRSRLQGKEDISQEEKSKLAWAEQKVEEGRLYYAQLPQMKATKGEFANSVEEMMATKGNARSIQTKKPKQKAKLSDVSKRHLIVALIDRSDENGKMTAAQWKQVHSQLVESLFARMEDAPDAPMPTFDGAGWLNGVKILKCNDDPTRKWQVQVVPKLEAQWEGAKLEVVDREMIPPF